MSFEVGAAASGVESYLLVEEGELDPLPSIRRKGNLYLLSSGAQGARLLRGMRDQYFGDPSPGGTLDVSVGVLDSLEASAALLAQREAGVSCLAAVTNSPNRLALIGVGDFRAILAERQSGGPQPILVPRYSQKKMAMESPGVIERVQRSLGLGDRVILCCGPLAQALDPNDVMSLLSSQPEVSAQEMADLLASVAESAGGGSVLVLSCREAEQESLAEPYLHAAKGLDGAVLHAKPAGVSARRSLKAPLPWLLAVFAAVIIGSVGVDSFGRYANPPQVSLPAVGSAILSGDRKDLLNRLDDLWARGQKGDIGAWKDAVDLLRSLQSSQPGDSSITDRLREAQLNQQYGEVMAQLAILWGSGETSAKTVDTWAKAVAVLEGLQANVGGTGFLKPVIDKLYAVRINYGKALEAAGRAAEASATYEKARELDPSRPEASDALRRSR
ncbi:MAG: hypothetical protein Q8R28_17680 [Dehalococcoidia bacterium]|nr:hypothetical protein [Dehalococcoidia bacterium]